jgi:class 3 adenylate cyclase
VEQSLVEIRKSLRKRDRIKVFWTSILIGAISAILVLFIDFNYELSILQKMANAYAIGTLIPAIYLTISVEYLRSARFRKFGYLAFVSLSFLSLIFATFLVHFVIGYFTIRDQLLETRGLVLTAALSIGFATIITLVDTVRQFSGKAVIRNVLVGRYYNAKEENLVVLFLDLASSTHLAEKLGSERFFDLLNEFHSLAEDCSRFWGGTIYKYIGDGQIVIWRGDKAHQALQMILSFEREVMAAQDRIKNIYNCSMQFSAGIHKGPTLVGEIGIERREIGYWGDTINTAQRIQSACKDHHARIVMSEDFFNAVESQFKEAHLFEKISDVPLKGKISSMTLFKASEHLHEPE